MTGTELAAVIAVCLTALAIALVWAAVKIGARK